MPLPRSRPDQPSESRPGRLSLIYLLGALAAGAVGFISVPIIARALGPGSYGQLALALSVAGAVTGVVGFGSDVVLARFWFERDDVGARRGIARQWMVFLVLWSTVVVAVAAAAVLLLASQTSILDSPVYILVALVALVPSLFSQMLAQVQRNEFRAWAFAGTTLMQALLRTAIALVLILVFDLEALGVIVGTIGADVVVILVRQRMLRFSFRGPVSRQELAPLLRFGAPIIPGTLAFWAFAGLDRVLLAGSVSIEMLGAYAAAATLAASVNMVKIAVGQAWLPSLMAQFQRSQPAAASLIRVWGEASLLVIGGAAVCVGAFSVPLMTTFAGPDFVDGAVALPFLVVAQMLNMNALFAASGSTLAKRSGLIPLVTWTGVLVEVIAFLVLVPRTGLAGAGLAVLFGYLVMWVGFWWYSEAAFPVRPAFWLLAGEVALILIAAGLATWGGGMMSWGITAAILLTLLLRLAHLLARGEGAALRRPANDEVNLVSERDGADSSPGSRSLVD